MFFNDRYGEGLLYPIDVTEDWCGLLTVAPKWLTW